MSRALTYAGIGNRDLPIEMYPLLRNVAKRLEHHGYTLMSGGAQGADSAFASTVSDKRVWTVKDMERLDGKFGYELHREVAEFHHPAWWKLSSYIQQLMVRNVYIVRGTNYWSAPSFVLCYAKNESRGGTSHSLRVARAVNIPVYNLAKGDPIKVLEQLALDFNLRR